MGDDRFDGGLGTPTRGGRKRGDQTQGLGRSRGGWGTKIHALCDAHGHPLRFLFTPGQAADCSHALELMTGIQTTALIADKGYDANNLIDALKQQNIEVVIPPRSHRKKPREWDAVLYKERNLIERMFNKLKQFRRVATRYDKDVRAFKAFVLIASICLWLK